MESNRMLKQMLKRMRGTSTTELLIIMPVFLMLTLGALQYSLIYEAKSSLDYATFMSARAGAIDHARKNSITLGLAKSISPLYSPDKNAASLVSTIAKARVDVAAFSRIKILNPTKEAFTDFGVKNTKDNVTEIPNEMLHLASTQLGAKSKLNIQDANLLKVEVLYGYKLKVPFVNKVITTASSWFTRDPIKLLYLSQNRLPILATATVRMQTRAWDNSWVTKTADINKAVVDAATAVQPLPLINIKRPWASGPTGQGTPSQILKGIPGTGSTGPGSGTPGSGTNPTNPPTTTTPPAPQPPKCEGSDAATGWFSGIRNAASFVAGLWDGLVQQIGDIWTALTSPWQTLKGLWALGDGLINNTKATLNMLGDVFGADVYRLLNCGPYDKGKVIGTYVSPSFLIKLAGKLSKLGLADALKQTGKPSTPCKKASFGAQTPVWTGKGFTPIEKLVTGMMVASRNEFNYADKHQAITDTFGRIAPSYYRLETEYDVLNVTDEHPLWLQGKGWTVVKDVQAGDVIASAQGDSLVVNNTLIDKPLRVYNFSVANTPSYFVGERGVWAHNANGINCNITSSNVVQKTAPNYVDLKVPTNIIKPNRSAPPTGAALKKTKLNADGSTTYYRNTPNGNGVIEVVQKNGKTIAIKTDTGKTVTYKRTGYPDFAPHLYQGTFTSGPNKGKAIPNTIYIKLSGKSSKDLTNADLFAFGKGYPRPQGYTWHHNEKLGKMELVAQDAHDAAKHSGGMSIYNKVNNCICYPPE